MKRITLTSTICCGLLCGGLSGCGPAPENAAKPKKPPRVETAVAARSRLVERIETTGDAVAVNTVTLEATVEGPITFCPWREGDRVEQAGQRLIEIDRPLYRQELAAAAAAQALAQAKLDDLKAGARPEEIRQARESVRQFDDCTAFAKADLDRVRALVASGTLPAEAEEKARVSFIKCQTQLETAKEQLAMLEAGPTKTEIAVAQAAVGEAAAKAELARAKLEECRITAPFAGIVTEVYVRPGDLAKPRAQLLKMIDPASLVIRAGLPERSAAELRAGTEAEVRLDAVPGKVFRAKLSRVYPRIERDSRTRLVELTLAEPAVLLPRLFARVSAQGRVFENAVTVPDAALITTPRGETILYVLEDGKARKRLVETGVEQDGRVQILKGLQAGETVITAGNLNLRDGAPVQTGGGPDAAPPAQAPTPDAKPAGGRKS